jgi:uncharacterized protein (DUF433 family)
MSKTYVMTLRLPEAVGRAVERLAGRQGHKPAQLGAVAVDEFMRRRHFPLIDFRETAAGRVAYVRGTRLTVAWLAEAVRRIKGNIAKAAQTWEISPEKIRAALHYAETYPEEIAALREHAEANRALLEKAEIALEKAKAMADDNGHKPKPKASR